jgi:hypothetical protein
MGTASMERSMIEAYIFIVAAITMAAIAVRGSKA